MTLTNNLSMEKHVTNICRSAYIEIRRISNIRHYLTTDATKTLLCAFVLSKLDYCNSLLSGSPKHLLDKLQKVQNSAARLVFKALKHKHIKPLLQKLHWLPVVSRIQYKVATLCYNSFTESYPVYLSELLTVYRPSRQETHAHKHSSHSDKNLNTTGTWHSPHAPHNTRFQWNTVLLLHTSHKLTHVAHTVSKSFGCIATFLKRVTKADATTIRAYSVFKTCLQFWNDDIMYVSVLTLGIPGISLQSFQPWFESPTGDEFPQQFPRSTYNKHSSFMEIFFRITAISLRCFSLDFPMFHWWWIFTASFPVAYDVSALISHCCAGGEFS